MVVDSDTPYKETKLCDKVYLREFNHGDSDEFVWHRDVEDRIVWSDTQSDWLLQLDNDLPKAICQEPIGIKSGVYHRLIPGNNPTLRVKVVKLNV